jgi:thiol-disulfide isomerase/thioredoxin
MKPYSAILLTITALALASFISPVPVHQQPARVNTLDSFVNASKIVVIDYWFMGCAPCKKSIPDMNSIALSYSSKGVKFFGLNNTDDIEAIKNFKLSQNVSYPLYAITPDLAQKHYISEYPTTVIYKDGKVALTIEGYTALFHKQITEQLNDLLVK